MKKLVSKVCKFNIELKFITTEVYIQKNDGLYTSCFHYMIKTHT